MKIRIWILKFFLALAALITGVFCIGNFPRLPHELIKTFHMPAVAIVFAGGLWVMLACFFVACILAWHLLTIVAKNQAFSLSAVATLRRLKWSVVGMTVGLCGILPQVYQEAQAADAPGLMLIGFGIVGLPLLVALFLAVLQTLWQTAVAAKTENDLTV